MSETLTYVQGYQGTTPVAYRWAGLHGTYGRIGSVYSFKPSVRAKSLTFSLTYTSYSSAVNICYKVLTTASYSTSTSEYPYFSKSAGTAGGTTQTKTITVIGDFEKGTTYYLHLVGYTSGNYGYFTTLTGTVECEPAAAEAHVWNGTAWTDGLANVWNGAEWLPVQGKVWNGASWVDIS